MLDAFGHRPTDRGHRVREVQHPGARAELFHVGGDAGEHGDVAQGPRDARPARPCRPPTGGSRSGPGPRGRGASTRTRRWRCSRSRSRRRRARLAGRWSVRAVMPRRRSSARCSTSATILGSGTGSMSSRTSSASWSTGVFAASMSSFGHPLVAAAADDRDAGAHHPSVRSAAVTSISTGASGAARRRRWPSGCAGRRRRTRGPGRGSPRPRRGAARRSRPRRR